MFGDDHPKYAECLSDLGYYLLNVDQVGKSVQAYETAARLRTALFGNRNLRTAMSNEDLAYASYVKDYNLGGFARAKEHAETALRVMKT